MSNAFHEKSSGAVRWMEAETLSAVPGLVHAFTTRAGGVSEGIWSSLNLGFNRGDEPERVEENYRILSRALGLDPERLVFTRQVHKDTVRRVTAVDRRLPLSAPVPYEADGLVTNEKGLALFVFIADCIPILLSAPEAGAVGAVHAGWRGTVADIAGKGVLALCREYGARPGEILAAVGPGIGPCCFETGPEVPAAVRALGLKNAEDFIRDDGNGKFHVDLKGVNRALLLRAGLQPEHIAVSEECTRCLHDKYWSHRWTNGNRGVQAAVIMRKP